jgi:hypothetical protein
VDPCGVPLHIYTEHCPLPKNTELMLKCLIWIQSDSVRLILIHFVGDCVLLTELCNSWQVAAANVGPFASFWSGRPVTSAVTGCKHLVTVGYWLPVRRSIAVKSICFTEDPASRPFRMGRVKRLRKASTCAA